VWGFRFEVASTILQFKDLGNVMFHSLIECKFVHQLQKYMSWLWAQAGGDWMRWTLKRLMANTPLSYVTYSKENKVACMQADYSGVHLSTIHKSTKNGAGYRLTENHTINVGVNEFNEALNTVCPYWDSRNAHDIKKLTLAQWIEKGIKLGNKTVEIKN